MSNHEKNVLWVFVLLGLAVRLYGINSPLVDSHQIRQAQTAMMARNLYEDHMDIFHTRLDFFGNVPGYIILEFPLMHGITALLYNVFGVHEIIGRLVSVGFSVGAMILMYGLARQFLSAPGAFAALALYAFSPMNIYFSRAFMPESSMMFFTVGSIYFFLRWLDKETLILYLTAILCAALACLAKPTAGMIYAPIFAAWFLKYRWGLLRRFDFWLYILLTTMPIMLWGAWAHYFNAKQSYIPFGFGGNWTEIITTRGSIIDIWLDSGFYKFVGGSIILLLLTPLGFIGTAIGVLCSWGGDRSKILYSWLGAVIAYFYVLAGANSGHIYYHLPLLPVAALFFGFAAQWLLSKHGFLKEMLKRKSVVWLGGCFVFLVLAGYAVGYYKFFRYMYENRMPYTLEAAKIIREHFPKNCCIIVNQPSATASVETYYSHGKSWDFYVVSHGPITERVLAHAAIAELERLRTLGATTYLAMDTKYGRGVWATQSNKIFWQYLNEHYKPIALTDHYLIFDLRVPLSIGGKK